MRQIRQAGFTVIEAVIVIVIVGALLAVGVWVVKNQSDNKDKSSNTSQTSEETSADVPEAPAVEDTEDLDAAQKALDESDLDAGTTDNSQLDSQTSGF